MHDEHVRMCNQILVVEDHPESGELLRMILEDEGYGVQSVETGCCAIQAVLAPSSDDNPGPPPDLILPAQGSGSSEVQRPDHLPVPQVRA